MNTSNTAEAISAVAGGTAMTFVGAALFLLAVLALFMPAFIYLIYKESVRMRKIAEKNHWQIDQIRKDLDRVKQKWGA